MTLYYEGSDGSIINLMGDGVYAQNPEALTKTAWQYDTVSAVSGIGRIKRFYKQVKEAPLSVEIMADDDDEFNDLMYNMHRTFERDVRRVKPGRLWWNDWHKDVFAVDTTQEDFEELFQAVNRDIKFISVHDYWIKEVVTQYAAGYGTGSGGIDYDHDYGFDYGAEEITEVIKNDCIDAANFEIKFYGPATNPSVTIGGHTYEILTTLSEGEYATINSLTRKVTKRGLYGDETNIFHLRGRDDYVFEKIPEGVAIVIRSKEYAVDITIYDERGEPEWI